MEDVAEKSEAGVDGVAGLVGRVREHKIVQWALAYLGAAITVAHGEELAAHAFAWNDGIARWLLAFLLVGFPVALTLAWYHGHKGLTRITQGELMISSILLLIGAGLLVVLVRPPRRSAPEQTAAVLSGRYPPAASLSTGTHLTSPEPAWTQLAGTQLAGTQLAGTQPAGAQLAGTQPAGAQLAATRLARAGSPTAASSKPRIAVLPFENLSPDPANAFFADGVHEEILTELANHAPGLAVISSTTMSAYKGKAITIEKLARELGCTYVLEGSLQRENNEVRLTLQLIDARNDSHMWAQDYDRKLVSVMALESEVAAKVTEQLSLKFAGAIQSEGSTSNPLAYDLYLKARAAEGNTTGEGTPAGYREAELLLGQAIAADPKFARAYLERMSLGVRQFLYNFSAPSDVLPRARADLATAERLAPNDPVVTAFAAVLAYAELDYSQALQLFEAAETAGLADPELLDWKNKLLFAMGRYAEAVALSRRIADLDPKNESAQNWWWYMLMELHRYSEAWGLTDIGMVRGDADARWKWNRACTRFYAGGDLAPAAAFYAIASRAPVRTEQDRLNNIELSLIVLNLESRFQDYRSLVDHAGAREVRLTYHMWPMYRVGPSTLAESRGWMDLLLGDRVEAQRDAGRIEAFLSATRGTKWNQWFRELLRADVELLRGNGAAANRTAAAALALARSRPDVSDQMDAYVWSTQILAWTDQREQAVERLEQLATTVPGLWPGEITGDPIFNVPLASLARYKALVSRLNAQMRTVGLSQNLH